MKHHSKRARVRLAEKDGMALERCACGTHHLHIGQLSLRLSKDAVNTLREVLEEAAFSEVAPRVQVYA